MNQRLLPRLEDELRKYQGEHQGERPLYILLPSGEAKRLIEEVREANGLDRDTIITQINGSRIVSNDALKPGDIQLTNELPETGS